MTDYERYQLEWMLQHGYSLNDLIRELTNLQFFDTDIPIPFPSQPISDVFAQWECETGFNGEIWACESEWKDWRSE